MKEIRTKEFFEWFFSDVNSEGITIDYTDRIDYHLFPMLQKLFNDCVVVPKRLVIGDYNNDGGDYKVNEEVILVITSFNNN
jgi:hypothetical protein